MLPKYALGSGLGVSINLYKGKIVLVMGVVMDHLMQICCTDHWRHPSCASINEQSSLGGALIYLMLAFICGCYIHYKFS